MKIKAMYLWNAFACGVYTAFIITGPSGPKDVAGPTHYLIEGGIVVFNAIFIIGGLMFENTKPK